MKAVVGVLVWLFSVSHGAKTYCDGRRQNGTLCYGASGETMDLQLINNVTRVFKLQLSNKTLELFTWKASIQNSSKWFSSKYLFTASNGTFTINKLNRNDDGPYTLTTHDSNGKHIETRTFQLTVQEPLSSVLLLFECLSQGELRVSCSAEGGDSPRYSWTLDGHTLTEAQLLSGNNETNNITLSKSVSGRLVCSVSNDISRLRKEMVTDCGSTTVSEGKGTSVTPSNKSSTNISSDQTSTDAPWYQYLIITAGVLSGLVILLVVGVACVNAQKKKHNKGKEEKVENELMYAEVRIMQQGRQAAQGADTGVEYSQVRYSNQPRQTAEQTSDSVVYGVVREAGNAE